MLAYVLTLLLTVQPYVESRMDVIELNHVYDDKARHRFSQVILWRDGNVAWYWMVTEQQRKDWPDSVRQWASPARKVNGQWRMEVRHRGRWFRVISPSYRETWTHHDPEVLDKEKLQLSDRGGL